MIPRNMMHANTIFLFSIVKMANKNKSHNPSKDKKIPIILCFI